jgi:CheY-like chemotaxis protein
MTMRERPTILTVDDNQTFLGILAVLLERLDFDVLPVTSSCDALDLARVARPQVITLNMQMPDKDSLTLMRELRADPELADMPVIMTTSERDKQRVWEAMSLGCVEVLDKPLELNRLHLALQRCNIYPEGRRRYLRAPFSRKVTLWLRGTAQELTAMTLSERGIMVRMPQPLPRGTVVEIQLTLPEEKVLRVGGEVIYVLEGKIAPQAPAGVAIKFDRVTLKDSEQLSALVRQLLIGDIVVTQSESVIKPD